jgi:AraC family transcriptional regulator of adaptative response/methylated-DNA-[protein]-cysteine methyltransferase
LNLRWMGHGVSRARVASAAKIPPGTTVSYGQIAERIGSPKAVRAVAQACRKRYCGGDSLPSCGARNGDISGYRWGVERKCELLKRESAV